MLVIVNNVIVIYFIFYFVSFVYFVCVLFVFWRCIWLVILNFFIMWYLLCFVFWEIECFRWIEKYWIIIFVLKILFVMGVICDEVFYVLFVGIFVKDVMLIIFIFDVIFSCNDFICISICMNDDSWRIVFVGYVIIDSEWFWMLRIDFVVFVSCFFSSLLICVWLYKEGRCIVVWIFKICF